MSPLIDNPTIVRPAADITLTKDQCVSHLELPALFDALIDCEWRDVLDECFHRKGWEVESVNTTKIVVDATDALSGERNDNSAVDTHITWVHPAVCPYGDVEDGVCLSASLYDIERRNGRTLLYYAIEQIHGLDM